MNLIMLKKKYLMFSENLSLTLEYSIANHRKFLVNRNSFWVIPHIFGTNFIISLISLISLTFKVKIILKKPVFLTCDSFPGKFLAFFNFKRLKFVCTNKKKISLSQMNGNFFSYICMRSFLKHTELNGGYSIQKTPDILTKFLKILRKSWKFLKTSNNHCLQTATRLKFMCSPRFWLLVVGHSTNSWNSWKILNHENS
jgi:hypothetical protein